MLTQHVVNVDKDRDILLKLHCEANYESETPWVRQMSYETYREEWAASGQSETYLASLSSSLDDSRTIAELWRDDGEDVGYVWVTFHDVDGYGLTFAEVDDITVLQSHRRRGVGDAMLQHVESLAKERGAIWIRAETGIEAAASHALHAKRGFYQFRVGFEELLVDKPPVVGAVGL